MKLIIIFTFIIIGCEEKLNLQALKENGYVEKDCNKINEGSFIIADCKANTCFFTYYENSKPVCEYERTYYIKNEKNEF